VSARRTAIAATFACVAGLAVAHAATDGFEAFTLESARRLQALRSPIRVPNLTLDLTDGGHARFSELSGRVLLVDFIYTSCPTLCTALGSVYAQLKQRLAVEIAADDVRLVSISFDPERDSDDALRAYRARYSPDPAGWELGRPEHAGELRSWLDAFGVVVIPDGLGGFAHNAAVHVVGPERKLVAIHDLDDLEGIVKTAREFVGRKAGDVALR
jgi:protein SCO1/2